MDGVVIVGGGLAAARVVQALRRRDDGIAVTVISAERHMPYDRPPLSKDYLAGEVDESRLWLVTEAVWEGVDVRLGVRAERLSVEDRMVWLSDGTWVRGDHIVIATGSAPKVVPSWPRSRRIQTLRTIDDSRNLSERLSPGGQLVIIGAGFIGCEVAATAREMGVRVSVVDALDTPCQRGLGRDIGALVADLHRKRGVDLRLGTTVADIEDTGDGVVVELDDGSALAADNLLVAIGAGPVTSWLLPADDEDEPELVIDDGVVCDEYLRAENGGGRIWAVGDVARWQSARAGGLTRVEHWTNATESAEQVVANMLDTDDAGPYDPVPFVWSDQYDVKIQVVGDAARAERFERVGGSVSDTRALLAGLRATKVVALVGWSNPKMLMRSRHLVDEDVTFEQLVRHVDELRQPSR